MVDAARAGYEGLPRLEGRPVYTRAALIARYRLGLSTLERMYRDRAENGHPEPVGQVGKAVAWDARGWDAWYREVTSTQGLLSLEDIARRRGVSRATAAAWWGARAANGHPGPVKKVGKTLYFDAEEHDRWVPPAQARRGSGHRAGDPEERITLAEFARILGMPITSVTNYPNRPPRGWPDPVATETLPSGRLRRWYTRRQAWDYDEVRGRHGGGRPAGPTVERDHPYAGDPRLDVGCEALRATPRDRQAALPAELARAHGGTPGTWGHILAAARKHRP